MLEGTTKKFTDSWKLALSLATWVTLFGLPVYSEYISWAIFGRKDVCGANKMGWKANVGTDDDPVLVNMNHTLVLAGYEVYAWCGVLPASYFNAWPGVVQTMIFTVAATTGTTVKQACQGISGTFLAVLNVYIMSTIFPMGGADPNYEQWMGYANVTIVLFLFLVTKADTNTMMLGMNWTVGLMMHFMNPNTPPTIGTYKSPILGINWDGETTVTMLTCLAGCSLSIVATVFPLQFKNMGNVHNDTQQIIKGIDEIFTSAIDYWAASSSGPKRFTLYAKMNSLNKAVARVKSTLEDAWWETFDLGSSGRVRQLYLMLCKAVDRNSDEVFLLKAATQCLDFEWEGGKPHQKVVEEVKPALDRLKASAIDCLSKCRAACADGSISATEGIAMDAARATIQKAQAELSEKFQKATGGGLFDHAGEGMYLSKQIAPENLFIFSISMWAQECADWAGELKQKCTEEKTREPVMTKIKKPFKKVASNIADTFNPAAALEPAQLQYALANFLPIICTYLLAMNITAERTVFVRYDSTMPGLLAYMITKDHFIPFLKNAQKLTGIVFGHTMPLLVMSVITLMPCDSPFRFVLHMASIWTFHSMFNFMTFASDQWAGVGQTIAAFGVYPLFQQCAPAGAATHYGSHYRAIAQTIVGMMTKIFFSNVLAKQEPRDQAINQFRAVNRCCKEALDAFFLGIVKGPEGLESARLKLSGLVSELAATSEYTDPNLAIVPGKRAPFKHSFLKIIIDQYKLILSDMDMLVLAVCGGVESDTMTEDQVEFMKILTSQKAWAVVRTDLIETIHTTLDMCEAIIAHDTEKPMQAIVVEKMKRMTKVATLEGIDDFYKQVYQQSVSAKEAEKDNKCIVDLRRTKLMVAMNALSLLVEHSVVLIGEGFNRLESKL